MNLDLSGKTALVCGSTQGLGYASAAELALLGCNVILLARNEGKLIEAVKLLSQKEGQKHQYLVADFTNTATYTYYRLNITANGGSSLFQMAEWRVINYPLN